jgi:hypothetical protein
VFQGVDERPSQRRPDLGQPVDGLLNQGCAVNVGLAQLEEPALDRFEEDDVPSHPTNITPSSYRCVTVRFSMAWCCRQEQRPGPGGSGAFVLVIRCGQGRGRTADLPLFRSSSARDHTESAEVDGAPRLPLVPYVRGRCRQRCRHPRPC